MPLYNTYVTYNGDGTTTDFAIPFPYAQTADVAVSRKLGSVSYIFYNSNTIRLSAPLAVGDVLTIQRLTAVDTPAVTFRNGAVITAQQLNAMVNQLLYASQEVKDTVGRGLFVASDGTVNFLTARATNAADPQNPQDLVTKAYGDANYGGSSVALAAYQVTLAQAQVALALGYANAASSSATAAANSASTAASYAASINPSLFILADGSRPNTGNQQYTSTGAIKIPVGTQAQRPTALQGHIRFNTTTLQFEGYSGTAWGSLGGGATGGGSDRVFMLNDQTVTTDYSIPSGQNALTAGPITINNGVTVTIPTGSTWTVI